MSDAMNHEELVEPPLDVLIGFLGLGRGGHN